MRVNKGTLVKLSYELFDVEENGEKSSVEVAPAERPLEFIQGVGLMLPAFEAELMGLEAGERFDFTLAPEDAYGEAREDLLIELPKEAFHIEGEFDSEIVFEGALVPMLTDDGQQVSGLVQEITDDKVFMDFNHALAGCTLQFVGEILEVREPTEAEYQSFFNPSCGCAGCSGGVTEGGCTGCH